MRPTNYKKRLAELVTSIARAEWEDEDSTTYKNRETLPSDLRDGFILCADMGGVLFLDARGAIRVFLHDTREELQPTDQHIRIALGQLDNFHPDLLMLVRQVMAYG